LEQPSPGQEAKPAPRELILLSPFRVPAQSALYLGNEDVACFLNGYLALWHPALLLLASGPPRISSPYDHEQPAAGHVYAVPENPPLILPDDWQDRVVQAGAVAFRASTDRAATLANLLQALRPLLETEAASPDAATSARARQALAVLELPGERVAPFFGLGFGHVQLEALFEAMDHQNLLDTPELWQELQQAAAADSAETARSPLESAAQRLLTAREVLYPVSVHLLDLHLLTDDNLDQPFPASFDRDVPLNLVASASRLERLATSQPERMAKLRTRLAAGTVEACGGCYAEREDPLLPLESQVWNLRKGLARSEELLGQPVRVFARGRFGFHPQTPSLLQAAGLTRAVVVAFDEGVLPSHRATVVNWSATDGKQVDAFCRAPRAADNPQTYFHVAHYLHETIMQDHAATLVLLHTGKPLPWYEDWLELSRLAPVLGQWTTLSRYFDEVTAGDYTSPAPADEFHADYLGERTADTAPEATTYSSGQEPKVKAYRLTDEARRHPVSAFAAHARSRRQLDAAWTFAGLYRSLAGQGDPLPFEERLVALEDQVEASFGDEVTRWQGDRVTEGAEVNSLTLSPGHLVTLSPKGAMQESAQALAQRLLARAEREEPGQLLLNPCSFPRRVVLELEGLSAPIPVAGPVKACQLDGSVAKLVVEVPALGFAWVPQTTGKPMPSRMRLADDRCVRNEFFEAEVDPQTGGLRGIRDNKTRVSRLGQQMVFNPGSVIRVKEIKTTSTGPAYGEIVSEGTLLDEQGQVLATFRQRFRAWLGRPVLDLRLEVVPVQGPTGYPWHSYFGARFAWRDERTVLLRGVNGLGYVTSQTRPETPDYLELREGRASAVILTGGLPFHQRHGGRMLDVILVPEGEQQQGFDLAIGLDREHPMLTAFGMVSPVAVIPSAKGPPHVGATGWLFHLDAPNLLMTSLRPAPDGADGVVARLVEVGNHSGHAELRCVRDPQQVRQVHARGAVLAELGYSGDTVYLDVAEGELLHLRIDFTREEVPQEPPGEVSPPEAPFD
jgi:hypothetical protein